MRIVLIKHDPGSLLLCALPRTGHTRVLLAFYTPSVTSKSLLISLLFLERPIFVFKTLSVWRSPVLALHLFRPACSWVRWSNVHDFTSVLCSVRWVKGLFFTCQTAITIESARLRQPRVLRAFCKVVQLTSTPTY